MRHALRHFVSEFIGTFALVFVGGLTIMMSRALGMNSGSALLVVAAGTGITLAVFVTALMRISGHFNPAVTIGLLAARRLDGAMAGVYLAGQVLGAVGASYLHRAVVPLALFTATRGAGQSISLDVTGTQAFVLEMVVTFFLVFVVFGSAVDPDSPRVGGLAIGLMMFVGILAIGPMTGASLNPARSFGPAVVTGVYEAQLIYWFAPILGGILAGVLYDQLFLRRSVEPVNHGALQG